MTELWTSPEGTADDGEAASFWLLLVIGAATMAFGIAVLAWPEASVHVMAVMLGLWFLLTGLTRIVGAFLWRPGVGGQLLSGIVGILLVIAGVACLRDIAKGAASLAFVIALVWIFSGVVELVLARQSETWARRWLTGIGTVSLLVGFVFVLSPRLTLTVMALLTGLSALVIGGTQIVFALRLRRLTAREPAPTGSGEQPLLPWDADESTTDRLPAERPADPEHRP